MEDKVFTWSYLAELYRFQRDYNIEVVNSPEFQQRQSDFYISLINHLYDFILSDNVDGLSRLVQGLNVFTSENTIHYFTGVNQELNRIYVSAIFYICDYDAICSMILKECKFSEFANLSNSAQNLLYILSGGSLTDFRTPVRYFMELGDSNILDSHIRDVEDKIKNNIFESPEDYLDTIVYNAVLKRFKEKNLWQDLRGADSNVDWTTYVQHSLHKHIITFLPSQRDVLNKGLLAKPKSFSFRMPTSAGKSYLTEVCIYHELVTNPQGRVLYITPLRSLAFELKRNFESLSQRLDIRYKSVYGGSNTSDVEAEISEAQLLITTPEMMMSLEKLDDDTIGSPFTLIICDEAHLVDDYSRGVSYEMLISRLKKQNQGRFLFISAIIPNIEQINEWLGGDKYHVGESRYRPVKLYYSEIDKDNVLHLYNSRYTTPIVEFPNFIKGLPIDCKSRKKRCACALLSLPAGGVMLYCTSKNSTRGLGGVYQFAGDIQLLCESFSFVPPINYSKNPDKVLIYSEYLDFLLGDTYALSRYVRNGFAYHTADLPQDIREDIENLLVQNALPLVVCTSTLAQGVNFPIKTIVLGNIVREFDKETNVPIYVSTKDLANIVGRAGRAGKHSYGTIILPEPNYYSRERVINAMNGENLKSNYGFLNAVVEYISQHKELSPEDLDELFSDEMLAGGIDTMISTSCESVEQLENVDVKEIIEDTLAYYVGGEEQREKLLQIFEGRRNKIRQLIPHNKYKHFKQSGVSADIFHVEDRIMADIDIAKLMDGDTINEEYICWLLNIVTRFPDCSWENLGLSYDKIDNYVCSILGWLRGLTYKEISQMSKLSIDEIFLLINKLQYPIIPVLKRVGIYMTEELGIDFPYYDRMVYFLAHGVDKDVKCVIMHDYKVYNRTILLFLDSLFGCYDILKNGDALLYKHVVKPFVEDRLVESNMPDYLRNKVREIFRVEYHAQKRKSSRNETIGDGEMLV